MSGDTRLSTLAIALGLVACAGAASAAAATAAAPAASAAAPKQAAPIDINSASRTQLKTLPGIGDTEAERIVSGRPYRSKADLAARDVIATGVYLSLKDRIIARQSDMPRVGAP
jgi:DNA uptake protein ComE-like DNA-binding protein